MDQTTSTTIASADEMRAAVAAADQLAARFHREAAEVDPVAGEPGRFLATFADGWVFEVRALGKLGA
jgi:hypothetical protein